MQRILYSFLFSILCTFLFAQQQQVFRGVVVDSATFSALPFVSIQVKGTMRGTATDMQGNFTITASHQDTLLLSLVGYQTIHLRLWDYEPSLIRMTEKSILLKSITIEDTAIDPYEGMFDDEIAKINARKVPFYFSRSKKQKRKLVWLKEDNVRAKTYVDVVINNPETKAGFMKEYSLTEEGYYSLLAEFNTINHQVMYYLTSAELLSLLNRFYEKNAVVK